ncbi:unnamed protein product, partial [Allacma fusca]
NTALHIAVMLGHKECVQLLLAHGAPVKAKNSKGWSSLAEAISYGDRPTSKLNFLSWCVALYYACRIFCQRCR